MVPPAGAQTLIDNKDTQRAMVIIDSQDPSLESLEERLRRSNSFLKNLLHSSVDGVSRR